MNAFSASDLLRVSNDISLEIYLATSGEAERTPETKERIRLALNRIISGCDRLNLKFTRRYAERCLGQIDEDIDGHGWSKKVEHLEERFNDEIEAVVFYFVPDAMRKFYESSTIFGTDFATKFPLANREATDAAKCFGTTQYTACVFHLMRALEIGLRTVSKGLQLPPPVGMGRNWGSMLNQIAEKINANNKTLKTDPKWQAEKEFFESIIAHFEAVKNAWRNPVMHVEGNYDGETSMEIFRATRGLMRIMATRLAE